MAKKVLTHLDFAKNQIWNVALQNLPSPPSAPVNGQIYYNTTNSIIYYWDNPNTQWVPLTSSAGTITSVIAGLGLSGGGSSGNVTLDVNVDNASLEINADIVRIKDAGVTTSKIADSNVTTIKIADNSVTFSKVQDIATMTVIGRLSAGTGDPEQIGITSDLNTSAANTLATSLSIKTYIDTAIAALGNLEGGFAAGSETQFPVAVGGTKKGDYWYVTTAGTVQGILLNVGDVLIAKVNNASITDPNDWVFLEVNRDQATTAVLGVVRLATNAEAQALADSQKVLTPAALAAVTATELRTGIAEIATQSEVDAGVDDARIVTPLKLRTYLNSSVGGYAANIGDGIAVSFALTHGLSTADVLVSIYDNTTKEEIITEVFVTSSSVVTVTFNTPPTSSQYRVVIKK
jgi:hypothetical protein